MPTTSLDLGNQALMNLFIGVGLVLLNLLIRYFLPFMPQVVSVLRWGFKLRVFLLAYLIALVIQLVTSPIFRSMLHSVSTELAWSPYQAFFNVLGVVIMDLLIMAWSGVRQGAEVGRKQIEVVKEQAAEGLESIGTQIGLTEEAREAQAARLKEQREAEARAAADRKQRLDDKLGDY